MTSGGAGVALALRRSTENGFRTDQRMDRDTTCTDTTTGPIDSYDNVTPTTNAGWLQVMAIRVAVVARSGQYEKDAVTSVDQNSTGILWDVGTAAPVAGSATCHGTSKCLTLKLDSTANWTNYRYKVYDTVIPLRNLLWKS